MMRIYNTPLDLTEATGVPAAPLRPAAIGNDPSARRLPGGFALAANQLPTADKLLALLPESPDAYPQTLDPVRDAILVVQMDAAGYRAASFLDDRILGPTTQGAWFPVAAISDAARRVQSARAVHFIFHTGHVGSTLVSRLLDESGDVLSLREPLPLRTLADARDVLNLPESLLSVAQSSDCLSMFMKLWGRGYAANRAIVVKATSSAGRLAIPLLEHSAASRAIVHESARRAVSGHAARWAEFAARSSRPRGRTNSTVAGLCRGAARAVARIVDWGNGGDELAR